MIPSILCYVPSSVERLEPVTTVLQFSNLVDASAVVSGTRTLGRRTSRWIRIRIFEEVTV